MEKGKVNEIFVRIEGYEKIKVKRCKHKKLVLICDDSGDWAYCEQCGLRTPAIPHRNDVWAEEIFKQALKEGKAFRDMKHLRKVYFIDRDTKKIEPSLCYSSEEMIHYIGCDK